MREAAAALERAGARLVEIDLEWPVGGTDDYRFFLAEEAGALQPARPARRAELGPDVVADQEAADRLSGREAGRLLFLRMQYQQRMLERLYDQGIDLVLTPTEPCPPPHIGTATVPFAGKDAVDATSVMCGLTGVFNALGWPAISGALRHRLTGPAGRLPAGGEAMAGDRHAGGGGGGGGIDEVAGSVPGTPQGTWRSLKFHDVASGAARACQAPVPVPGTTYFTACFTNRVIFASSAAVSSVSA